MNTTEKLLGAIGLSLFAICVYWLGMVARSDGRIDHCWVDVLQFREQTPIYAVRGHRNWRSDVLIASAPTVEEAEAKRKLLCPEMK